MRKIVIVDNKRQHTLHIVNRLKKTEARLAPGLNRIPFEAWQHLKAEQNVADRIGEGWLIEKRVEEEAVDVNYYLNENAARARTVAKNMSFDRPVLEEWLALETRPSVAGILKARLDEVPADDEVPPKKGAK